MTFTALHWAILGLSFYGFLTTILLIISYNNHRRRVRGDYNSVGRIRSVTY